VFLGLNGEWVQASEDDRFDLQHRRATRRRPPRAGFEDAGAGSGDSSSFNSNPKSMPSVEGNGVDDELAQATPRTWSGG
jgi:hypothetical protein